MSNTPIKLTPFYQIAQRLNARFADYNDWKMPEVYTTREAEIEIAQAGVVLADETPNGKLIVEGHHAESALGTVFDHLSTLAINAGMIVGSNRAYRLRRDLFFISTQPDGVVAMEENLMTAAKESPSLLTITNVTHGQSEVRVIGPDSRNLLSKLCALDFHASVFPDGSAKQSSLAKTTQLIIRRDIRKLLAFSIIGARSMGPYVWETVMEAGDELGLTPIGCAALDVLEK